MSFLIIDWIYYPLVCWKLWNWNLAECNGFSSLKFISKLVVYNFLLKSYNLSFKNCVVLQRCMCNTLPYSNLFKWVLMICYILNNSECSIYESTKVVITMNRRKRTTFRKKLETLSVNGLNWFSETIWHVVILILFLSRYSHW